MNEFTTEELLDIYSILYDEYYYGQELMYQATEQSENIRRAMEKIDSETKRRARSK